MGLINAFTQVSFKRIFMLTLAEGGGNALPLRGVKSGKKYFSPVWEVLFQRRAQVTLATGIQSRDEGRWRMTFRWDLKGRVHASEVLDRSGSHYLYIGGLLIFGWLVLWVHVGDIRLFCWPWVLWNASGGDTFRQKLSELACWGHQMLPCLGIRASLGNAGLFNHCSSE